MLLKYYIAFLALISFLPFAHAQSSEESVPVQVRMLMHAPIGSTDELYYTEKEGEHVRVDFRYRTLSAPFDMMPVNGNLVLYDTAEVDPKNPGRSIAAVAKLPPGVKRAIVVVVPMPEGRKPAYQMMAIDDSEKAFPGGESLVMPLLNTNVVIEAGEHTVPVPKGKLTRIPKVKQKNAFNIAQTNFHYQKDGKGVLFAEQQIQYLDTCRRLFIIHFTPGAIHPSVITIMDVKRAGEWR